ncbi:hypothetical protein TWF694_001947 [Orbilia ellipsospora]|uniref:Uncharacterized protein n=1 Tax=Orbilia ellipsospora TaxID=2528407 RepID=A0AAV9X5F1_9PEZI
MRGTFFHSIRPLLSSRRSVIIVLLAPPLLYTSATFVRLLHQYPTTKIHPSHPVYISRDNQRFKQTHVHWFSAKVPLKTLLSSSQRSSVLSESTDKDTSAISKVQVEKQFPVPDKNPVENWTFAFFSTPTLSLEASSLGWLVGNGFNTGDQARDGVCVGQGLAHGLFRVIAFQTEEDIIEESKNMIKRGEAKEADIVNGGVLGRVIVEYSMPDGLVRSWEVVAARYGWPWRHLSGGRHCLEVVSDGLIGRNERDLEDEMVAVRFGCAVDLERVNRVNGQEDAKLMPWAFAWLHEMYARWLVDGAVNKLMRGIDGVRE